MPSNTSWRAYSHEDFTPVLMPGSHAQSYQLAFWMLSVHMFLRLQMGQLVVVLAKELLHLA